MRQAGLFGLSDQLKRLSDCGDPLEMMGRVVDFEVFRPELEKTLAYGDGARVGRPPYDPVAMFKVLILAAQNSVSDARMASALSAYHVRLDDWWICDRAVRGDACPPMDRSQTIRPLRRAVERCDAIGCHCQRFGSGYIAGRSRIDPFRGPDLSSSYLFPGLADSGDRCRRRPQLLRPDRYRRGGF